MSPEPGDHGAPVSSLHLTNAYHPTSGGVRTFYEALLEAAERHGRRVALVVPGPSSIVLRSTTWTRVYAVRAPRSPVYDRRYRVVLPHRFLRPGLNPLRRVLRAEVPHIVEVNDKWSLCYLAGVLRKGWWPEVPRPTLIGHSAERADVNLATRWPAWARASRLARWYMRSVYVPLFDYHVANSPYTADEIREALPDGRAAHVHWLPMGVDTSRFGPRHRDDRLRRDLLARLGAPDHATLLLAVGRLSPEKDLPLLLDALARLAVEAASDFRLVIAGDGPQKEALQREADRRVPGRVLLPGHVGDGDALARMMASADAFVHANAREPFGIAPLEAMASGTPVVLPDSGGVLAYATAANAWLYAPGGEALARVLREARDRPAERRRRAAQALRDASALDWARVTARWFAQYDDLHRRGVLEWQAAPPSMLRGVPRACRATGLFEA